LNKRVAAEEQLDAELFLRTANAVTHASQAVLDQQRLERFAVGFGHLQHAHQFLVEQRAQRRFGPAVQMNFQAAVTGKGHLQQGDDDAAVGAIVIGQQQAAGVRFLHQIEHRLQPLRIVQIRRHAAAAVEHLGQRRTAETIATRAEIDQPQIGVAAIELASCGVKRAAHVADAGKSR
jgi:hypothetical protein